MVLSEIIEVTSQKFNTAAIQILSESGLPGISGRRNRCRIACRYQREKSSGVDS